MEKNQFNFPNLYAGSSQVVRGVATLAQGQKVKPGTVLGRINSTGEVVIVDKTRSDSATSVFAVANDYVDATDQSKAITVDFTGEFDINQLEFAPGNTAADHQYSARLVGIFFKQAISK